ncbi:MAG TPA: heavy metal-associated domain-containing protein [Dysgonamonadaceae bacterium]|nr:heavy metal-associated domain-containing protein [Dysgonamonadaceae bacterium]
MTTIRFQLEVLTCPSCINKIESVLQKEQGVESAKVLFNSSKVRVNYDEELTNPEKLAALIEKLGYPIISI